MKNILIKKEKTKGADHEKPGNKLKKKKFFDEDNHQSADRLSLTKY